MAAALCIRTGTAPSRANAPYASESEGLCGLGHYARPQPVPGLRKTEHRELCGIVTGSPEKAPRWQRRYDIPDPNVYSYETLPEIANNDARAITNDNAPLVPGREGLADIRIARAIMESAKNGRARVRP